MRNHDYDLAPVADLANPLTSFSCKLVVTRGQSLVNEKDLGIDVRDHRKHQARLHSRRVGSDRVVNEFPQFGEGALCGLTAPGHITVEPIGSLETKDATRTRIKWYCSLALFANIKAAALIGVQD